MGTRPDGWTEFLDELRRREASRVRRRRLGMLMFALLLVAVSVALARPAITAGEPYVCGLPEHAHGPACYDAEGVLVCTMREHAHTQDCLPPAESTSRQEAEQRAALVQDEGAPQPAPAASGGSPVPDEQGQGDEPAAATATGSSESDGAVAAGGAAEEPAAAAEAATTAAEQAETPDAAEAEAAVSEPADDADAGGKHTLRVAQDDYTVTLTYGDDAGLGAGTTLLVRAIDSGTDECDALFAQAVDALGYTEDEVPACAARFFDITLMDGDTPVEPQAPVQVSVVCDTLRADDPSGVDAAVVHFSTEGTEVLAAELVPVAELAPAAGGDGQAAAEDSPTDEGLVAQEAAASEQDAQGERHQEGAPYGFSFVQESFSVSGLVVRGPDVPKSAIPSGAQVAKKRSYSELENGGTYLIYAVLNSNVPYAIDSEGALHEMRRTTDGNNIYPLEGGAINESWLWNIDRKNTQDDGIHAKILNVAYPNTALYPRSTSGRVVETASDSKALIATTGGVNSNFTISEGHGTYGINITGTDWAYVSNTKKTLYIAEVPTVSSHTATQVNASSLSEGQLLEGYYVISRTNDVTQGTGGVITLRQDPGNKLGMSYRTDAYGVASRKIQGFYSDAIWHIAPDGNGRYVVRNLWSGERLTPDWGSTTDTLAITTVDNSKGYGFSLVSTRETNGALRDMNHSYPMWEKASTFNLYRVDDDGFYHAYFDTSLGGNAFYQYTANSFASHVQYVLGETDAQGAACHTVHLPTADEVGTTGTANASQPYRYRLNGWWDVYGKQWYAPGAAVVVYGNAVFYADWVAASYDIGQPENLSSKAVYMPAITTQVFDYNELFNVANLDQLTSAAANVSASGHAEQWADRPNDPASFLFIYRDAHSLSLHNLDDGIDGATHPRAPWNASHSDTGDSEEHNGDYNGTVTAGILTQNPGLRQRLFDPSTAVLGKTYVGADHNLYSYDYDTGYYYYDSNRNAASYNQSAGRFYVYDYTNRTNKSLLNTTDGTWRDNTDFLPLNYGVDQTFTEGSGDVNYWFGMKTEFYFFLPNDATTDGTKNKSIKGDEMSFRFSGDDDVWVLVDDKLVLDLGGVHGTVFGEMNFSQSSTTVAQNGAAAVYELKGGGTVPMEDKDTVADDKKKIIGVSSANGSAVTTSLGETLSRISTQPSSVLGSLKAGNHKLTLLYLERGSSESNAAIYFNVAPVYQIDLNKVDSGTGALVSGASFEVYTDAACTEPASNVVARKGTTYRAETGFSDQGGIIYLDGLVANQDYYLVETSTPTGYRSLSGPAHILISGDALTCWCTVTYADGTSATQVVDTATVEPQGSSFSGVYGGFTVRIPNSSGREMPAAGGPGPDVLVVVGALVALAAAGGLIGRRKLLCSTVLVAVGVLACSLAAPRVAWADAADQGDATGSLAVLFEAEGMPFSLYRVADVRAEGTTPVVEPLDAYAARGLDWDGARQTGSYDALAQALAACIAADGIAPDAQGETQEGSARFAEVESGLYLVMGGSVDYDGYRWSAVPTLASVPNIFSPERDLDVAVSPKQAKTPLADEGGQVEYRLVKHWVGDSADVRPAHVSVTLVHGGEPWRTVELSDDNNWTYAWTAADDGVAWTAAENDVPVGYVFSVFTEGTIVTVRNTRRTDMPPERGEGAARGAGAARGEGGAPHTGDDGGLRVVAVTLAVVGAALLALGHARRADGRAGLLLRAVGSVALVAVCGLLAAGVQAEAGAAGEQEALLESLRELMPEAVQQAAPEEIDVRELAVVRVDGYDLAGYVQTAGDGRRYAVRKSGEELSVLGLGLEQVQVGEHITMVDVSGKAGSFVVDAVGSLTEDDASALNLHVEGMAKDVQLSCTPQ